MIAKSLKGMKKQSSLRFNCNLDTAACLEVLQVVLIIYLNVERGKRGEGTTASGTREAKSTADSAI